MKLRDLVHGVTYGSNDLPYMIKYRGRVYIKTSCQINYYDKVGQELLKVQLNDLYADEEVVIIKELSVEDIDEMKAELNTCKEKIEELEREIKEYEEDY